MTRTVSAAMRRRGVTPADVEEWIEEARRDMPPGTTVYTTLKHVARSGMSRRIDVHIIEDNEPRWYSYRVAAILGEPFDERTESVNVGGAGMDMGFHLVYSLSRTLYPEGFDCIGKDCPSNAHSNGMPRDRALWDKVPNGAGDWDTIRPHHNDGGYALVQRWL